MSGLHCYLPLLEPKSLSRRPTKPRLQPESILPTSFKKKKRNKVKLQKMALWHQIRRSAIQRLLLYSQNPNFIYAPVRSFAAPVQTKKTEESSGPRINGAITASYVRLVTDEGHGVVSRWEALDHAKKLNLDLVEVQRTADPPVCKIMDFHKEKFKQEVKEKERTKTKSATLRNGENKEVRFNAKTELKDLKIKAETVTRLMERGYRVKCTALPSGKEAEDLGGLLLRLLSLIEDVAVVESGPHVVDTKQSYVIVRHVKFATKKSGKKAIKPLDAVTRVQSYALSEPKAVNNSIQDEEWEQVESDSETEIDSEVVSEHKNHNIQHSKPLPPSPPKSVPDSFRPNLELKKEPSVVEINRYAKPGEPKRPYQQRERMPLQATRNESDARGQFDPKLRQFNNSSNPTSPPSGYGRFNSSKSDASIDQNNLRAPIFGKLNNQKPVSPNVDKPNNQSSSVPILGKFNISKTVPCNQSSSIPISGKLNTSQTVPSGTAMEDKSRNPSPTPSNGKFSASKTVPSSDKRKLEEVKLDQTRNPSSPARSYGIFSK